MPDTVKPKRTKRFARTPKTDFQPATDVSKNAGEKTAPRTAPASAVGPTPKPESKSARVIALLQRKEGATLDDMVTATGWLPHTTRAAMTGLKRKGHAITSVKTDGVRRYHIQPVATAAQ